MSPRSSHLALLAFTCLAIPCLAQQEPASRPTIDPRLYASPNWRNVGPFRGGRVSATAGAIGQPGVFYAGYPGGGVWKTTSAGAAWTPVFDSVSNVSSIGSVAVAPSNPDVVYVGTGDMITAGTIEQGNGVYRSTDAGKSWQHLGLERTKHTPEPSKRRVRHHVGSRAKRWSALRGGCGVPWLALYSRAKCNPSQVG